MWYFWMNLIPHSSQRKGFSPKQKDKKQEKKGKRPDESLETKTASEILIHADCVHSSLTGVDFLMSLEKIFLNEAHITLAALKRLLTWSFNNIYKHHYMYNNHHYDQHSI